MTTKKYKLNFSGDEINNKLGKIDNKLDSSELNSAINIALEQAKTSGDFKGEPGVDGVSGKDGKGITSTTISTNGELILTYTDGETKNLGIIVGKDGSVGASGKDGKDGINGVDGKTPYIKEGYWWIGETNTNVKAEGTSGTSGKDGTDGKDGKDGLTPFINSLDNWQIGDTDTGIKATGHDGKSAYEYAQESGYLGTEADFIDNINPNAINSNSINYISTELAKRQQLKPEFVSSLDECIDTSKLYVLPDGFIYGYMTKETQEIFVDVLKDIGYTEHMRINSTGGIVGYTTTESDVTGYIPVKLGDVIRLENITMPSVYTDGHYWNMVGSYTSDKTFIRAIYLAVGAEYIDDPINKVDESGNIKQFTVTADLLKDGKEIAFIAIDAADINNESKIFVNSTKVESSGFTNTGHAFVPADYEGRVIELENEAINLGINLIPEYWSNELETKAEAIRIAVEEAGRNKSAFLWYTDAHWQSNSKKSPLLLKYLVKNTPINKVNFGGDIINDPNPYNHANTKYVYDWRKMIADLPRHHSVYGNHDVNHRTTDVSKLAYEHLLAPEETAEMIVGGDSYYYIDNSAEKTRYLYLSYLTSDQAEMVAQGQFIVEALASVKESWHIVVIAHRWFQYTSSSAPTVGATPNYEKEILQVLDEYNARASHVASNYFAAHDFSGGKGKVEFCIGGHIHVDYDFTTAGGIPVIITASDTNQERVPDRPEDSGAFGTITESAIFGIIANYNTNKITVVGIGRGTSREITY